MKKIILGLAIVLVLSFCVAGIASAISGSGIVTYSERGSGSPLVGYGDDNATKCSDTDGGKNAYVKGRTCVGSSCETDKCGYGSIATAAEGYKPYESMLMEYYCGWGKVGYGYPQTETAEAILKTSTVCANRCEDGACVKSTNPYCIEEGGRNPQRGMAVCCSGLVVKQAAVLYNGKCSSFFRDHNVCLKCGDGLCDTKYENLCNCPEDCDGEFDGGIKTEPEGCISNGGILSDLQGVKGECCAGLHEISSGYRNGVAYCTSRVCGNGECEALENQYNCPEDCAEPTPVSGLQPAIDMVKQLIQDLNTLLGLLTSLSN